MGIQSQAEVSREQVAAMRRDQEFPWTTQRLLAASLIADGHYTDNEVAERCGIKRGVLQRYLRAPLFQQRVQKLIATAEEAAVNYVIARKRERMQSLNERWQRGHQLIAARAQDMADEVQGGETGLLIRQTTSRGAGNNVTTSTEYYTDTALLKELREMEKQAAIEMGQWLDKKEISGPGGQPFHFTMVLDAPPSHDEDAPPSIPPTSIREITTPSADDTDE